MTEIFEPDHSWWNTLNPERFAVSGNPQEHLASMRQKCADLEAQLNSTQKALEAATASTRRWQEQAANAEARMRPLQTQAEKAMHDLMEARREADRWRRVADMLQTELSAARERRSLPVSKPEERYRRIKTLLGKSLHPDNSRGVSSEEAQLREKIFKELWPQIELIERQK